MQGNIRSSRCTVHIRDGVLDGCMSIDAIRHVKSTTSRASSDDVDDTESLTSPTRLPSRPLLFFLLTFFSFFLDRCDAEVEEEDACRRRSWRSSFLSFLRCLSSTLPRSSSARSRNSSALREWAGVAAGEGGRRGARGRRDGAGGGGDGM